MNPFLAERSVMEVFFKNNMHHAGRKGGGCGRSRSQMNIGQHSRGGGLARIDHNKFYAVFFSVRELAMDHIRPAGIGRVGSPDQHDPGFLSGKIAQGWKSIG